MSYSVNNSGRLLESGRAVDLILSPYRGSSGNTSIGYSGGNPKVLVYHFTYGGTARSSADWFADRDRPVRNPRDLGSSAHLIIDRDGTILQCVPLTVRSWHAGTSRYRMRNGTTISGLNAHSIGIELANWGYLEPNGNGRWRPWARSTSLDPDVVVLLPHENGSINGLAERGWEKYTEAQLDVAIRLGAFLCAQYGISEVTGHDVISRGRKWDPGPAFPLDLVKARILGRGDPDGTEDGYFTVTADSLNVREGPGMHHPKIDPPLPQGTKVQVQESSGNWRLVDVIGNRGPDRSGWVYSRHLI